MSVLKRLTGRDKSEKLLNYIKRKAQDGSEMHQFMLDKFESFIVKIGAGGTKTYTDPKTGNKYNFDEAVKKARQAGILHYVNLRKKNQGKDTYSKWTDKEREQHWKNALGHSVARTQKGQEVEYYKAKKAPRAKGPPLWALGRAGTMTKIIEAVKKPLSGSSSSGAGGPLARYLPDLCPYCGKTTVRYIKKDLLYCDSCGWSGKRSDLSAASGATVTAEQPKALPPPPPPGPGRRARAKGWLKTPADQPPDTKSIMHTAGKRIKPRIYEVLIFIAIGLFCLVGTPFFGLPSFFYLAMAFIITIPAYILLPGRYEVLGSIVEGQTIGRRGWALFPKSLMKIVTFILIIFEFFLINRLASLVIAFVFYFFLPTRYKTDKPDQIMEAWIRMGFGVYLAIIFFMTFGGNTVGLSLLFMGLAFFATFPIHIEADKEDSRVEIRIVKDYGNATKTGAFSIIDKVTFSVFMLAALFLFGVSLTPTPIQLMFYMIWGLSFFTGLVAGPEGKPALGALTILIAVFAFSSTYTGVVGQAIFGYWWPQVQSFTETVGAPLADMWTQAQSGMSDAWLMMTNPQAYYIQQQQKQQATKSAVKSGGTVKSIELSKFDLFPGLTGILDPRYDKLVGSIELQNQGEFEANRIVLDVWSTYKDPETLEDVTVGTVNSLSCSKPPESAGSGIGSSQSTCDWSGGLTIYPSETKLSNFVYDSTWTGSGIDLKECVNATGKDPVTGDSLPCPSCSQGDCVAPVYKYSGEVVKVNVNYTYDYNVNVSMPVDVINSDRYMDLLEAREITLQDITSQYTGGPVKATIWSQRQPIRNGEQSLFVASIYNEGNGILSRVNNFEVRIPTEIPQPTIVSQTFRLTGPPADPDGCSLGGSPVDGYWVITCSNTYDEIEKGEFKRVSFFITPDYSQTGTIPELIDRKTTLIIGLANYEYIKTSSQSLTIANAPPQ
jgi:hypothetical protein